MRSLRNLRRLRKIHKVGSVFLKVRFSQGRVVKYKGLHEIFPRCMLNIFSRSARVFSRSRPVFPRSILTFHKVGLGFLNYQLRREEAGTSHHNRRCVFSGFLKTSEFQKTGFPRCSRWHQSFPRCSRCSANILKVRKASQGADFDLGILKVPRQRPWEFSRCNRVFRIRPGADVSKN